MQEKSVKAKIDLKGKTVLVTGAAGFIGSFLSERLLSDFEDIRVIGFDSVNDYYDIRLKESRLEKLQKHENFIFIKANLADKDKVSEVFREYSPQIVVNLAAQAGVRYSITNPDAYIESNIIGFYNILEACRHSYDDGATSVEHLVYASSSSVYGSNKKVPYSTDDKVDNPVSLYAATKKSDELMAHAYSKLYNIPSTGLRTRRPPGHGVFRLHQQASARRDDTYFQLRQLQARLHIHRRYSRGRCARHAGRA